MTDQGRRDIPYDGAADGLESWALAIRCMRERGIRGGVIQPLPSRPHEARWKAEGPVENDRLDVLRDGWGETP
ncbi:hypothetical protein [Microbaculum marinisediminis]|uniref:Uncharacterized protein n=1 Tax=Microbaculum marinisediminis TaxID=2931392 RepID=A0AAW5QTS0_9HYPH|nr:hypothetical protein [Microbaculum sp. A6E488]MCT8970612.1 hypothetical protein [Microbaculum sp. A6E488]